MLELTETQKMVINESDLKELSERSAEYKYPLDEVINRATKNKLHELLTQQVMRCYPAYIGSTAELERIRPMRKGSYFLVGGYFDRIVFDDGDGFESAVIWQPTECVSDAFRLINQFLHDHPGWNFDYDSTHGETPKWFATLTNEETEIYIEHDELPVAICIAISEAIKPHEKIVVRTMS